MKPTRLYQTLNLILWICTWAVVSSQFSFFALDAAAQEPSIDVTDTPVTAAQEPTAVPTPTPAPTWTPNPNPTDSPPAGVPIAPTQSSNPVATPTGRVVDFRVDDDEINVDECIQFSWVVRGDIDRVEFDNDDDNKEPLLVSELSDREECPAEDAKYQLIVWWLDGSRTTREIGIDVHTAGDDVEDGSSGSGSSGSGGTSTAGEAGAFIPVTPILITTGTPTPQSVAAAPVNTENAAFQQVVPGNQPTSPVAKPAGALSSVGTLPETGALPPQSTLPEDNSATPQPQRIVWLTLVGGVLMLLSSISLGLVLLMKWLRPSPCFNRNAR